MKDIASFGTALLALGIALPGSAGEGLRAPAKGLLFYAKHGYQTDTAAARNPHIQGALFQIYWSAVEKSPGRCDWSAVDAWMAPWKRAGKGAALRILWSTSGYWPDPAAVKPTPAWVFEAGAAKVVHEPSGTEIPLFWDPIYRGYALRFLRQLALRYDADPSLLFLDMTPGAETNPYRFGTINDRDTAFPDRFRQAKASDGRAYEAGLWVEAVTSFVDSALGIFAATPLLVTLNRAAMPGDPDRRREVGAHCAAAGAWVGQNGLTGSSYQTASAARDDFLAWSARSRVFFETLFATTDPRVGTLLDVMKAGERAGFGHLNIYPEDALRGTRGHPSFDPAYEAALAYGSRSLAGAATATARGVSYRLPTGRRPAPERGAVLFPDPGRSRSRDALGKSHSPEGEPR